MSSLRRCFRLSFVGAAPIAPSLVRAASLFGCLLLLLLVSRPAPAQAPPQEVAGMTPAAELKERRRALAAAVGEGLVRIEARGGEDEPVTRAFFYLTGLETVGGVLLLQCREGKAEETLFLPPKSTDWERWNGPRAAPSLTTRQRTGVDAVLPLADLPAAFEDALEGVSALWHLPTASPRAGVTSPDDLYRRSLRDKHPQLETVKSIGPYLNPLRQIKGAEEIRRLRRAVAITGQAFQEAFAVGRAGSTEYALEAAIESTFRRYGAEAPGFPSIVGSGDRSCILHYKKNAGPIEPGDLIVIDVGASWGGYTADITRTIPASGRYSARQREVYEIVEEAQAAGIAAAKPGATFRDIYRAARAVFDEAGVARHLLHGVSHHVGLEVHDVGRTSRPLAPGMVLTVEPGLYFPNEELGIRIEDMILITEEGCEVLSREIPKSADALEAAMRRAAERAPAPATGPPRNPRGVAL